MSIEPRTLRLPETTTHIALCGGPYNNFAAVAEFLRQTAACPARFCLGDMGGFGPHPDRTIDQLRAAGIHCIQGNYDSSIGNREGDCGCGYLDPLDRKYAQLSYDYTDRKIGEENRAWLAALPPQLILEWHGKRILLCHGSPGQVNEFVWNSETSDEQIAHWLKLSRVDGICVTHTGIPWVREVPGAGFWFNVGVLGRPAHEGLPRVYYGLLKWNPATQMLQPELRPLDYDSTAVVEEMRKEGLPEEFCQSLLLGTWTTCSAILPPAEAVIKRRI